MNNKEKEIGYKFRYDDLGNVLFLDTGTPNYDYRWVWTRQNHSSQTDDWFLVCFPNHHANALKWLPREIELAQRAYDEIMQSNARGSKATAQE